MNQLESKISKALSACRSALFLAGVFSLCVNLLMLTVPIYLFQVFDRVLLSGSVDTLMVLTFGAIIALAALAGAFISLGAVFYTLGFTKTGRIWDWRN